MSREKPERPNILFLLSDDQGPWAMGCAGNDEISTPNLDAIAAAGTRLENFFCASPVCSPARASLMTGQIPSHHGVHDYLAGSESSPEVGPGAPDYLAGQRMFTDALAENGYRLGLSGKWHLGANDAPRRGFTHWYALEGGGSPYRGATMHGDGTAQTVPEYLTDSITDDAMSFLDAEAGRDEPFFLSVNYTAPHKPWKGQHPPEFEALYTDCEFASCPQEEPHPWQPTVDGVPIGGEPDVRSALIGYFAAVSAMDAGIGAILARLDTLGIAEDTLVIFGSDNGFNCGHHGIWGKGNGTYPQNMYDSSVKVPAIFRWPGRIDADRVCHELVSGYDMAATIVDLAGLECGEFEQGPGQSFADLLRRRAGAENDAGAAGAAVPDAGAADAAEARERPVVVFDEYGPVRMIRTREWKYIHRYPDGPHELYHLERDPGEQTNLLHDDDARPMLDELRAKLSDWFIRHTRPDVDGSTLPVAGAGQVNPVGGGASAAFTPPNWDGTAARRI